jgi:hypothetical protein
MEQSKTQRALAMIAAGSTVRAAARAVDISEAAVHRARKALRDKEKSESGICPACGGPVGQDGRHT